MLVGRLVFVVRDALYDALGKDLQTLLIVGLFLSVHKLGWPYPCEREAEVVPRQLDTVPLLSEDAGIVPDVEGQYDQQCVCVYDIFSKGIWWLQVVPTNQDSIVLLARRVSYYIGWG